MNRQRLSMLSLMLVAAAGWAPSAPVAAANAATPQSLAATPLVFDTWVPGPCSPNGQPQDSRSRTRPGPDRYVIESEVVGPIGRGVVRSAWIVRRGETIPRLTSCFVK